MPLYEYQCESCGEREEKLEGFDAPNEHDCVKCGATGGMRRQISTTSFTLAGGGWMAQGYQASGAKGGGSAAPASGSGCGGGCACHASKAAGPSH